MAITCEVIRDRVRNKLVDIEPVDADRRWPDAQLLEDFNAALAWLMIHKPEAGTKFGNLALVAGPRQTLPAVSSFGGQPFQLLRLKENMGAAGTAIGRSIRHIERNELDNLDVDWPAATGAAVEHFTFDPDDKAACYIYPAITTLPWEVSAVWVETPAPVTSWTAPLPVLDLYQGALANYVMGSALTKHSKSGDANKGMAFLQMAEREIGIRQRTKRQITPIDPDVAQQTGADR